MPLEDWPLLHSLVYHPRRHQRLSPGAIGVSQHRVNEVTVTTDDGLVLNGWHLTAPSIASKGLRSAHSPRVGIVYYPGRGGHRGFRVLETDLLLSAGAEVLLVDYRGYGDNPGKPGEQRLIRDALQVWKRGEKLPGWSGDRMVIYGESLGGSLALLTAAHLCQHGTPPAGVIVRSTFTSMTDAARWTFPWLRSLIPRDWYDSVRVANQIQCPFLDFHGVLDPIVPIAMGRTLFDQIPPTSHNGIRKRFIPLPFAVHNRVAISSPNELLLEIRSFVDRVGSVVPVGRNS